MDSERVGMCGEVLSGGGEDVYIGPCILIPDHRGLMHESRDGALWSKGMAPRNRFREGVVTGVGVAVGLMLGVLVAVALVSVVLVMVGGS